MSVSEDHPIEGPLRRLGRARMAAVLLAGIGAVVLLAAAGCGGDKPPPGTEQADTILAATSNIVYQCRAVERGFLSSVDEEALDRDVDALVEVAEEIDPDAEFRRPQTIEPDPPTGDEAEAELLDPETTLRDQAELAIARLEDESCSPEDAERLREALDG